MGWKKNWRLVHNACTMKEIEGLTQRIKNLRGVVMFSSLRMHEILNDPNGDPELAEKYRKNVVAAKASIKKLSTRRRMLKATL